MTVRPQHSRRPLSFGSVANPAAGRAAPVSQAVADSQVALDWQRTSMRTVYTEAATPIPLGALYLGFTAGAMYDAVKTAYRRHASPAAAAAVAAHHVLLEYFSGSKDSLDADLATSLGDVPEGQPTIEVIRRTLGEETPLLLKSSVTGTERQYATLTAIEYEAFHARIWGGLHFRNAMEDGYDMAHTTARQVMNRID